MGIPDTHVRSNWTPRRPTFSRQTPSGAKEGLAQKMKYWSEKDFQYEFGVTVGAAMGLARQDNVGDDKFLERVYFYFTKSLEAKLDTKFIDSFKEFYALKLKSFEQEQVVDPGTNENIDVVRL